MLDLRGHTVQAIVTLANIVLTPQQPARRGRVLMPRASPRRRNSCDAMVPTCLSEVTS